MLRLFGFLLIAWLVIAVARIIWIAFLVLLAIVAVILVFMTVRSVYHFFNPLAKAVYLEKKKKSAEESRERESHEAEARRVNAERSRKYSEDVENQRIAHRDADVQKRPYTYQCVGHPNRTLALRYGIVNQTKEVKEYWYHGPGGVQQRNPDRDVIRYVPGTTIRLMKYEKIQQDDTGDHSLAVLPDHGNRKVRAVIQRGEEFTSTFYPLNESWFKDHADLEMVLKNNEAFDLKELANFHVQKVVRSR